MDLHTKVCDTININFCSFILLEYLNMLQFYEIHSVIDCATFIYIS
jgi:hypothetical protein